MGLLKYLVLYLIIANERARLHMCSVHIKNLEQNKHLTNRK